MNWLTSSIKTAAIVGAIGLVCASSAQAQSLASFQVTSFSAVASGGILSWLNGGAYQSLAVDAAEAGGLGGNDVDAAEAFALGNASLAASVAHAAANASTTSSGTLGGNASAMPFLVSSVAQPHGASAMAQQSHEFTLSAAGTVTFTIGYVLTATAPSGISFEDQARAALELTAGIYGADSGVQGIELIAPEGGLGSFSQTGTLQLVTTFASANDVGFYNLRGNAWASAVSSVPEPSQTAMLLAGFAVAGLVVRRRSAKGGAR